MDSRSRRSERPSPCERNYCQYRSQCVLLNIDGLTGTLALCGALVVVLGAVLVAVLFVVLVLREESLSISLALCINIDRLTAWFFWNEENEE